MRVCVRSAERNASGVFSEALCERGGEIPGACVCVSVHVCVVRVYFVLVGVWWCGEFGRRLTLFGGGDGDVSRAAQNWDLVLVLVEKLLQPSATEAASALPPDTGRVGHWSIAADLRHKHPCSQTRTARAVAATG